MTNRLTIAKIKTAEPAPRDYFIWDDSLPGFGVKICKGGRKSFVYKYRFGRGRSAPTRRITLGDVGSLTLMLAKQHATKLAGQVAEGDDPASTEQSQRKELTVGQLCEQYLQHGTGTKKPSTLATDKGRIERHIKPLLGHKKISRVTKADVQKFLSDVATGKTATDVKTRKFGRASVTGGKGTATRTVGLLGGIFSYAVDAGLLTQNPAAGVKRFKDKRHERFLTHDDLAKLGTALASELKMGANPDAMTIIKLLLLTGARKSEIEQLRWTEVDLDYGFLRLDDSKTGQKHIVLNNAAIKLLRLQPKLSGNDHVFPSTRGSGPYVGTSKVWRRARVKANMPDIRLHDLRHTFASMAVQRGHSLPQIGAILGHRDSATTLRYAHMQENPLKTLAEDTGTALSTAINSDLPFQELPPAEQTDNKV